MSVPRTWRLRQQRYRLVGEVCDRCGVPIFPPRDVCPECEAPAKTPFTFSGRGEVYSYSTVYHPPVGFKQDAPYTVALVRLEEGPLVTAQLTDVEADQVEVGMPVEMVTRRLQAEGEEGVISYGYKFRPLLRR
ncbi:MAG TPA: Zn-ribbon domain-containing OB-fold protein [Anaerolineales bacterium]|nr:Zn-ribbon domain-containing OB-fold protein [Anaerolineae bacterium]HIQ01239.1 Zn-ribbon domain-containing OB-fold protein [Anaerolineales bacterium]